MLTMLLNISLMDASEGKGDKAALGGGGTGKRLV
jgi:hypothetical protein